MGFRLDGSSHQWVDIYFFCREQVHFGLCLRDGGLSYVFLITHFIEQVGMSCCNSHTLSDFHFVLQCLLQCALTCLPVFNVNLKYQLSVISILIGANTPPFSLIDVGNVTLLTQ